MDVDELLRTTEMSRADPSACATRFAKLWLARRESYPAALKSKKSVWILIAVPRPSLLTSPNNFLCNSLPRNGFPRNSLPRNSLSRNSSFHLSNLPKGLLRLAVFSFSRILCRRLFKGRRFLLRARLGSPSLKALLQAQLLRLCLLLLRLCLPLNLVLRQLKGVK